MFVSKRKFIFNFFQYQVSLAFLKTCWDELYKIALQKSCDENLMIFSLLTYRNDMLKIKDPEL